MWFKCLYTDSVDIYIHSEYAYSQTVYNAECTKSPQPLTLLLTDTPGTGFCLYKCNHQWKTEWPHPRIGIPCHSLDAYGPIQTRMLLTYSDNSHRKAANVSISRWINGRDHDVINSFFKTGPRWRSRNSGYLTTIVLNEGNVPSDFNATLFHWLATSEIIRTQHKRWKVVNNVWNQSKINSSRCIILFAGSMFFGVIFTIFLKEKSLSQDIGLAKKR